MHYHLAISNRVLKESQNIENQLRELQHIARRQGRPVVEAYTDHPNNGARDRDKRPVDFGKSER